VINQSNLKSAIEDEEGDAYQEKAPKATAALVLWQPVLRPESE
jgi:hypothetical protein